VTSNQFDISRESAAEKTKDRSLRAEGASAASEKAAQIVESASLWDLVFHKEGIASEIRDDDKKT
jgi:hypothetical protein